MNLSIDHMILNSISFTSSQLFTVTFVVLLLCIAVYSSVIKQGDRKWWGLFGLSAVLVILSQMVMENHLLHTILLDAASFTAVAMVWMSGTKEGKKAARTYLVMLILAIVCIEAGLYFGEASGGLIMQKATVALLVIGVSLKLAFIPFYFWLPEVAEKAKPMTTALIVSIIDIAAFQEMIHLRSELPWVFTDYQTLWIIIALLSMLGGAILALSQTDVKRMLAFSTIDDMGYLLLGVLAGSSISIEGAVIAAISHAFCKVILFGAVGVVENKTGAPLTLKSRGMATHFPVSSAAFILAVICMLGVPPFLGFSGRWRLYLTGLTFGGWWLVLLMVIATALALLYYVRTIHKVWLGESESESAGAEPVIVKIVLILMIAIMLAAGLFPSWITNWLV